MASIPGPHGMASPLSPASSPPHPASPGSPAMAGAGRAHSVTSGKRSDAIKSFLPSNALQKATFEIVYILSKDTDLPERLTWLFAVLEDAQMFVFAFNAGVHRQMPAYVETIVDVFGTPNDPAGFTVMNACCIAVVFLVILLTAMAVGLAKINRVPILLLRILRLLFAVMINVLNIPLTTVLLMGLHCPTEPGNVRPVWCWPGIDITSIVLNSVAFISFLPMLWVSAVMFIDANPASASPMAKPDGQLELHGVILRLTLVTLKVFITGIGHSGTEVLVYLLLAAAGLTYHTHQLITTHPYFDPRMSMLRSGMHCGATFALVISLVLNVTVGVNSGDWWYLLIPASAVGMVVGALLSHLSLKRLLHRTLRMSRQLKQGAAEKSKSGQSDLGAALSPIAIAQRVRSSNVASSTIKLAGEPAKYGNGKSNPAGTRSGGSHSVVGRPGLGGRGNISDGSSSVSLPPGADNALISAINGVGKQIQSSQEAASEAGGSPHQQHAQNTSTDTLNAFMERRPKERKNVFESPRVVETCLRVLRDNPTPRQTMIALQLLEQGLAEFPRDPQLLLMSSAYLQSYYGEDGERAAFQVMQILQSGKVVNPPLHIRFKIYCTERSTREMGKHVLDSATITILMRKVRKYHLLSMCLTRDAWEAVRTSASESTLADVISKLAKHKSTAEKCYRQLLAKSSRDKNLLRLYSQFAHFVLGDTELAAQVLEHAEEVELAETEQQTKITTAGNSGLFTSIDQQTHRLKHNPEEATPDPSSPSTIPSWAHQSVASKQTDRPFSSNIDVVKSAPVLAEGTPTPLILQPSIASSPANHSESVGRPTKTVSKTESAGSMNNSNLSVDANLNNSGTQVKFMGRVLSKDVFGPLPPQPRSRQGSMSKDAFVPPPPQPRSRRGSMFKEMIGETGSAVPQVVYPAASIPHRNEATNWVLGGNLGNGSQTSGTSASRIVRKKQAARRRMAERVSSPLTRTWLVAGFTIVFLGTVVYGYALINYLFLATRSFLTQEYVSARMSRSQARVAAHSVRQMVHGNEIGSRQVWEQAYASAQAAAKDLVAVHIPTLATYIQSDALTSKPKPIRMFLQRIGTNQTIDYFPIDITSLGAVERIVKMTNLALGYSTFGELTQTVFNSISEFTWFTENMAQVFELLRQINYLILEGYETELARDSATIVLTAVISLICLIGGLGLIYALIFKEYFMNESRVINLLLGVPKRAASDLVTTLEAEIEGFMEIFAGEQDGLEEDDEVRASTGSTGIMGTGNNGRRGKLMRRQKHALMLIGFGSLLAALTASMYFFTMNALRKEDDLHRLLQAADQHNLLGNIRLYSNELFSPARAVPKPILLRDLRGSLKDFDTVTLTQSTDLHGLSRLIPHLTVLPRNCTLPTSCPALQPNVTVGLTRQMGELSLYAASKRFSEITQDLITTVAEQAPSATLPDIPQAVNKYVLLQLVGEDIRERIGDVANSALSIFYQRVEAAGITSIVLFAGVVLVLCVGVGMLSVVGLSKLMSESRALTTLPYLLPATALAQAGQLSAFVESGGLTLRQVGSQENM